jgi:ATP/maltotriose-dependent transcriptional regulator MalT
VVTLDTVKKHVTHVLGELGAANRTEAVTRARQLGPDLLAAILSTSFAGVMSQHE